MDGRIGAGGTHAGMAKAPKHHPRLAPVAHAVRIALAASAAAFALAGSGAAFAGEAGVVDDPSVVAADAGVALEVDAPVVEVGMGDLVGVYVDGGDDDAAVDNLTDIAVYSYDGLADGVFAAGDEVTVHNDGNIAAYAATWGAAIEAQGDTGAAVSNEGTLYAYGRDAFGIHASAIDGNVAVDNRGGIEAQGYYATGVLAQGHGDVSVDNSGDIVAGDSFRSKGFYGGSMLATGIQAGSGRAGGIVSVINSGHIEATSAYGSVGIDAYAIGSGGTALVDNAGSVQVFQSAHASPYVTAGLLASGDAGASIDNSGTVAVDSGAMAYGAMALAFTGTAEVVNSGDIHAHTEQAFRFYSATGVFAYAQNGAAMVDNSGTIDALATYDTDWIYPDSVYAARGIHAIGREAVGIRNAGDITVEGFTARGVDAYSRAGLISIANTGDGVITGRSQYGHALGIAANTYDGNVDITNDGAIRIDAGTRGTGMTTQSFTGSVHMANNGLIEVTSRTDIAAGMVASSREAEALAENHGRIFVQAEKLAQGIRASSVNGRATVVNNGDVEMHTGQSHTAAAYGRYGASVELGDDSSLRSQSRDGGFGAEAHSALGVAHVDNRGSIEVATVHGTGFGIWVDGMQAAVRNAGDIGVFAEESGIGIRAYGTEGVQVTNSGSIQVSGPLAAVGVEMGTGTNATAILVNEGSIRADAPGQTAVAVRGGDWTDVILNSGVLVGAIQTGAGNDLLENAEGGAWYVANFATGFGAGDDTISNAGLIHLSNGLVDLGEGIDQFENTGRLQASGFSIVNVGAGSLLRNNGVISLADGHAGDVLAFYGNLAGSGLLGVDVDLASGASDQVRIAGDLADGTHQRVDVRIAGLPVALETNTGTLIEVTGHAADDALVAGQVVGYDPANFLALGLDLRRTALDASTAFSASITVDGLSDSGVLAASVAPGAQQLVDSIVGTWQQRMGVQADAPGHDGFGPWFRYFGEDGDFDPQASGLAAGQDVGFEQDNRGHEFGIHVPLGDSGFGLGMLLGEADGEQALATAQGATRFDADFSGVYATWRGRNFYVDGAMRWIDLEARLVSAAGEQRTGTEARAFDIELGYTGWHAGGLALVPQLQYTRASFDALDPIQGPDVAFDAEAGTMERLRLGLGINHRFDFAGGASLAPYASLSAVHRMDEDSRYRVDGNALFDGAGELDGTSALVEAGADLRLHGFSIAGGVRWMDGGAVHDSLGGHVVVGYAW